MCLSTLCQAVVHKEGHVERPRAHLPFPSTTTTLPLQSTVHLRKKPHNMIRNLVFVATVATTLWGSIGVYATPIDQIIINLPLSPAEAVLVVNPAVVEPDTSLSAVGGKAPDPPKNTLGAVIRTYGAKKGGTSKCSVNPTDRDISWTGCWFLEDDYAEVVYQLCGDRKRPCPSSSTALSCGYVSDVQHG